MVDDLENVDLTLQVLKQLAGELLAGDGFDCYGNSRLLQAESAATHGRAGSPITLTDRYPLYTVAKLPRPISAPTT